jgi:cytochrome c peroxidase
MIKKINIFIFIIALVIQGCKKDPEVRLLDPPVFDINLYIPPGFPKPVYDFSGNNKLTEAGFKLGRSLFYDPILSRDNTISCGSCHQQFVAFAHSGHSTSHGIDGQFGTRNAPALQNLIWHPHFMHDGGVNHIEVQPLAPILNPIEMDGDLKTIIERFKANATYRKRFKAAFGDEEINSQRILYALTQFQGFLISYNSKYDKYIRGEAGVKFTDEEKKGLELFERKCASCHTPPLFSNFEFINIGLDSINISDQGRATITNLPEDIGKFKVPSLRNIEKTAPYMHDGRFWSLSEVLDHYRFHVKKVENLHPLLKNGIELSDEEKNQIIKFLKTLTDESFIKDPRFSDPFQNPEIH